jgi:DNA-binding beta-propeller fold protein YncE
MRNRAFFRGNRVFSKAAGLALMVAAGFWLGFGSWSSSPARKLAAPAIDRLTATLAGKPAYAASNKPADAGGESILTSTLGSKTYGEYSPCREISDPYPEFNGIAVDPINNVVAMSDTNQKSLLLYDRRAGSADSPDITSMLTRIKGPHTYLSSTAGVALDPVAREIYALDTDIGQDITAFPYTAKGDYRPRALAAPQAVYGLTLSLKRKQMASTIQDNEAIVFFRLGAKNAEPPLKEIRGANTGLADPHGISFDEQHGEVVVANDGSWSRGYTDPDFNEGGRFDPPSVETFAADAKDNAKPLRVIVGAKTELNWPFGVSVDSTHNEIAVANIGGSSVLVFKRTADGNVAPIRVLKGPKTEIEAPVGVGFDTVHGELWVANLGHTALVFDRAAEGDVAPKRIIRNAPAGTPATGIGVPDAIAYDSKRDLILQNN